MDFNSFIHILTSTTFAFICNLPFIVIGILGLGLVVAFHELGHFIFAKIFNVHTPSFSIGFGPRLIEKKIGDTVFAISAIPLGGYVEIAGSPEVGQGEQKHAKQSDERSFNKKPYWQKMLIISGGILFNFIFAYTALSMLFYLGAPCIGPMCKDKKPIVGSILKDSPAEKAGFKFKDKIISINNKSVKTIEELSKELVPHIEQQVSIQVLRNNQKKDLSIKVESYKINNKELPKIGVYWHSKPLGIKKALIAGWQATYQMAAQIIQALKNLTKTREGLGGPLIIIKEITKCASIGFKALIFILAFISINLGVFNIIPLPIFDGGQALFITIEAIRRKPLSDQIKEKIAKISWILVLVLLLYLTYKDTIKIAKDTIKTAQSNIRK